MDKEKNSQKTINILNGKKYLVDFELLKKAKQKGFCLCEVKKKEDNSNICPCNEFLNTGICKCMVFIENNPEQ